jgi:hypothetical protein
MPSKLKKASARRSTYVPDWRKKVRKAVARQPMFSLGEAPTLSRHNDLEKVWKDVLSDPPVAHSDPNMWRASADVRPSSFPFCGRKYVMERLGLEMPSDFVVQSSYYTEVGKAVHYVVQNALARTGKLWGFWLCARPTCEHRIQRQFYSTTPGFMPGKDAKCPNCGASRFEYEELVIADPRTGLRGHVDGVLVHTGYSSVLEVKTAGDKKVKEMKKASPAEVSARFRSESPWYGYWHQASTYAALLRWKYFSLPPILYVDYLIHSRDDPENAVSFRLPVPEDNSWWGEIRTRILTAQEALKLEIIPMGFAKSQSELEILPTCKWCSHNEVCLDPTGKLECEADALTDKAAHEQLVQIQRKEKDKWEQLSQEMS